MNASRGEQEADGRIREHRAGLPATQKSINLEWMPVVEKKISPIFEPTESFPVSQTKPSLAFLAFLDPRDLEGW